MASSSAAAIGTGKSANTAKASSSSSQSSPAQSQTGLLSVGDNYGQRRSPGIGGSASARTSPSPRNNQSSRKQHKTSKRFNRLVDDDHIAEAANMRTTSRKGQTSITHLMNYSIPHSYQYMHRQINNQRRHGMRNASWGLGSGYHAVDKARYVHANYRFIVDPRSNYHAQSIDADVHLDWNNVLQILVSAQSQAASCPICLGDPVAPRMARCGHIFCLPCLIRLMHSDDGNAHMPEKKARFKKCPLCHDSIYLSETRPVRLYIGQEGEPPHEGSDVVLRLIMRSAGSTLALPRDGAEALSGGDEIPWYFAAEVMDYARVMKGTEDYIMEQLDNDITALELQGKEDELMFGEDNIEWTQKAIRMLKEAKEKAKGIGGPASTNTMSTPVKPPKPSINFNDIQDVPEMYAIQHAANSGQSLPDSSRKGTPPPAPTALMSDVAPESGANTDSSSVAEAPKSLNVPVIPSVRHNGQQIRRYSANAPTEYYFYQALLHYYLSPLDIRILREAFGNFASFPATILPRVERVSTGHVVDDDLRKRAKYLAHLPHGCEVNFLECDWADTVPAEVLEKFKPDIDRRRKRNTEKEAREEKARLAAEKEGEKRYAHLRRKRPEVDTAVERPFSEADFQPLTTANAGEAAELQPLEDESGTSPPWPQRQGSGLESLASMSTSPSASRTIWGTPVVPPSSPPMVAAAREPEIMDDGWLQNWEKDLLNEEDMVVQAELLSLGVEGSKAAPVSGAGKKKKKKITLMSTNVRRGA